jgi:acyl carrier protein
MDWLKKVDPNFVIELLTNKFDLSESDLYFDSLYDMGLDDLDSVELLMEIERKYDIVIPDSDWEIFEKNFSQIFMIRKIREDKINKILDI